METCTRLVNGITPQPHNTCTLSRGWWDIRAFTDFYVDYNIFCSWMVLLLVYQMTKRIINQWNNWIIITIIWEPPWTVCDEAEPCNFLLFEVTICHDPVYHPHTSCHLMTPGYCLTSVRQSAAPQHTGDHCDSLSDTDTHHTTSLTSHLANQISLSVCLRSETACGFIWYFARDDMFPIPCSF